jgi:hypothetical protein
MQEAQNELPPCGIYRTTLAIGGVPQGALVYFHNHGNPGPGVYLPESWNLNKATFSKNGHTLPDTDLAHSLFALPAEGFYRVRESFTCCEKNCRTFEENALVQLGYNRKGQGILFFPTLEKSGMSLPERGNLIEDDRFEKLEALKVATSPQPSGDPPTIH